MIATKNQFENPSEDPVGNIEYLAKITQHPKGKYKIGDHRYKPQQLVIPNTSQRSEKVMQELINRGVEFMEEYFSETGNTPRGVTARKRQNRLGEWEIIE